MHNVSPNFQDYIQMYLGELTPIQESRLVQLKSWVSNLLKVIIIKSFLHFIVEK